MRITRKQFDLLKSWQPVIKKEKQNKYQNKKVVYDDIQFDSIKEKNRYIQLRLLEKAGEIKDLELQKTFILQPSFKKNGTTYRAITYKADFTYLDLRTNKNVVEDTKGFKTEVYKIKKKLFEYVYPDLELKEM